MQLASSRIWTRLVVSISNDDNYYATCTSIRENSILTPCIFNTLTGRYFPFWCSNTCTCYDISRAASELENCKVGIFVIMLIFLMPLFNCLAEFGWLWLMGVARWHTTIKLGSLLAFFDSSKVLLTIWICLFVKQFDFENLEDEFISSNCHCWMLRSSIAFRYHWQPWQKYPVLRLFASLLKWPCRLYFGLSFCV